MKSSLDRYRSHQVPGVALFLVVAASYLALDQFVMVLNDPVNLGAGFRPAAGLSLALLMLVPPSRWGWVLAGVAVAELGGGFARGYPLEAALLWAVGNSIEPLIGAVLLRRLGNPSGLLVPVQQLMRFVVAAVLIGPLVGGSIGTVGTLMTSDQTDVWQVWLKYFVGDALGVLLVAPLLLCWRERGIARHFGETITLSVALITVTFVSFRTWNDAWEEALPYLVIPYLIIPLLMWAAMRYGYRGAALGIFVTTQIANWFTSIGEGPFAFLGAADGRAITLLQFFLAVTAGSTLVLSALVEDLVDRTEVEARLASQAMSDALTGLPNRAALTSALSERIESASEHRGVGVCACDLDHFKVINDGLGHAAGDDVLIEVAGRMRRSVRVGDLVARQGGMSS